MIALAYRRLCRCLFDRTGARVSAVFAISRVAVARSHEDRLRRVDREISRHVTQLFESSRRKIHSHRNSRRRRGTQIAATSPLRQNASVHRRRELIQTREIRFAGVARPFLFLTTVLGSRALLSCRNTKLCVPYFSDGCRRAPKRRFPLCLRLILRRAAAPPRDNF
jgi:hypothetical protein